MRLECVVGPANPGIGIGDNDSLPGEPERPHLWRVDVIDARFDRDRPLEAGRSVDIRVRFRKVIVDTWITFHARDIGTSGYRFGDIAVSFHEDCVNDVESAVLQAALT